MPDGRRRSREHWADTMEAGPPSPPAHTHRLPTAVRVALLLLVVAQVLTLAGLGITMVANYRQQQYIEGRGEYRDREAARMEAESTEQIRRAMCDLLDTLPEGGLLDRPRQKYGCGPGIPLEQLSPEEQKELSGRARPGVAPPPPEPQRTPELGAPAQANPPRSPVNEPPTDGSAEPAPPRPEPESGRPPLPDFGPVTDDVCDALGVCL